MKLDMPKQDVAVNGDFATSDFAVGDVAFIVDMFADKVYTYKERAVIRELSCNAHDSHIDAGTSDIPFQIHLPTHLEPWFSVRDFGTGLTDHEIRTIFAGVGISTKRESNEMIGCFGIGSLSPYCLCDSFTVKSWKNGKKFTYSCYRDEDRKPKVALLSEEDSDESNGLEISLTIDGRVSKFEEEAINVYKWWDYTPEINNKHVTNRCDEHRLRYDFKGEDYAMNSGWGDMVAIMGNIAYAIPDELDDFNCDGYIRFDLGEISFDTARENLSLDDKTRAAIKAKFDRIKDEISDDVIDKIEQETTPFKQAIAANKLRNGQLGRLVKSAKLQQYDLPKTSTPMTYWKRYYRSTDRSTTETLSFGQEIEYYRHADRMQSRIKNYLKDSNSKTIFVLTPEQIKETKIDTDVLLDLEDLPKVVRNYDRSSGSTVKTFAFNRRNHGWTAKDFYTETEIETDGDEIVYVEISRWVPVGGHDYISSGNSQIRSTLNTLGEHEIDVPTVVALKTAFLKTKAFGKGNFIHLDDYVKREFKKIAPKTYYEFEPEDLTKINTLGKMMESEEVTEILELANSSKNDKVAGICRRIELTVNTVKDTFLQDCMDTFFKKYEMLTLLSDWEIHRNEEVVTRYIGGKSKDA